MSNASRKPSVLFAVAAAAGIACASEKPVPSTDVAPLLAAVVRSVDSAVGRRDSLAIDPRILPTPSTARVKRSSTVWSEGELAASIGPRHPRLELGKMAFACPVVTPGCVATKELPIIVLATPMLARDTAVVEAVFAGRRPDDAVTEIRWLWFAVKKDNSWRVVKHTTLDRT